VFEPSSAIENLSRVVADYFAITGQVDDGGRPAFTVDLPPDSKKRFLALRDRLEPTGLLPLLRMRDGHPVVAFLPKPPRAHWRWPVNVLLFVGTLGTTFLSGYVMAVGSANSKFPSALESGFAFSLSLMLILLVHEMGHKVISILRGIDASLPYFIPMVPPVGTMGAVIVTREPAPNRDALIDLGASGPIAGFVVAVAVVIIGVRASIVLDPSAVAGLTLVNYPDPLLVQWITQWFIHPKAGQVVLMHPILYAGWIGLLVTSLNLLPSGMLDGGHVVRSLLGARRHLIVSWLAVAAALALRYWLMAALMVVMLTGVRRAHPGPLDDVSPVSPGRYVMAVLLLAIFVVSVVRLDITPINF
jgi:membrane-associated protease RseP (regulator of RpoE activity)